MKQHPFSWDDAKRKANLRKHRIDFADARLVFAGRVCTFEDDRAAYSEQRFISYGLLGGVVVVICHVERGDETRIVSMRKAIRREAELYWNEAFD
jgi:uncharacterized DUF497 family protein